MSSSRLQCSGVSRSFLLASRPRGALAAFLPAFRNHARRAKRAYGTTGPARPARPARPHRHLKSWVDDGHPEKLPNKNKSPALGPDSARTQMTQANSCLQPGPTQKPSAIRHAPTPSIKHGSTTRTRSFRSGQPSLPSLLPRAERMQSGRSRLSALCASASLAQVPDTGVALVPVPRLPSPGGIGAGRLVMAATLHPGFCSDPARHKIHDSSQPPVSGSGGAMTNCPVGHTGQACRHAASRATQARRNKHCRRGTGRHAGARAVAATAPGSMLHGSTRAQ